MTKVLLFLLLATSNLYAQTNTSTSMQLKKILYRYEMMYQLRPTPGIDNTDSWHAHSYHAYPRIPMIDGNVGNTPDLSIAQIGEIGKSFSTRVEELYGISLTISGTLRTDPHLLLPDSSCYKQHYLSLERYSTSGDSTSMFISDRIFGMRMLFETTLRPIAELEEDLQIIPSKMTIVLSRIDKQSTAVDIDIELSLGLKSLEQIHPGCIRMTLLPADVYGGNLLNIPLKPEFRGKSYTLNGVEFTLQDFAPGNVMITSDTTSIKQISTWKHIFLNKGEYIRPVGKTSFPVRGKAIAKGISYRYESFVEWMKDNQWLDYILTSTPSCTQADIDAMWAKPDQAKAAQFHAAVGEELALFLIRDEVTKLTDSLQQQQIANYPKACEYLNERSDINWSEIDKKSNIRYALTIATDYHKLQLQPDFETIFRSARTHLINHEKGHLSTPEQEEQRSTMMYEFKHANDTPVVTRAEFDYLRTPSPQTVDSARHGLWYKTAVEAEAIIFYIPYLHIYPNAHLFELVVPLANTTEEGH